MSKKIDKQCDDNEAGIRFHISSARMAIKKLSYVAFQRYLDQMERSSYRCPACNWGGSGKLLSLWKLMTPMPLVLITRPTVGTPAPNAKQKLTSIIPS